MEKLIAEFLEGQSWKYNKNNDETGGTYYTVPLNTNHGCYQLVLESDFSERYFAVTAVNEKNIPPKHRKKVMNIYNNIAQQQNPHTHIFTESGLVAAKYNYEILTGEELTKERIDYMIEETIKDVHQLRPFLKKMIKKSKKKKVS